MDDKLLKENVVYRYVDLNGNIIYVGKTSNLQNRFNQHKADDMNQECYKVEYIEMENPADIDIYETYYINKYQPRFNKAKMFNCKPTFFIPEQEWRLFYKNTRNDNRYSTEIKRYENIFKDINCLKFNNELPMPRIRLVNTSADGKFVVNEVIKTDSGFLYTIKLDENECFGNTKFAVYSLLHNMVHMYNFLHSISDTSNNGSYHNKYFMDCVKQHGGFVGKGKYGYRISGVDQEIKSKICKYNIDYYPNKKYRTDNKRNSSARKYICPCCGNSFRATKEINVMCMDCNEQFAEV